VKRKIRGGKDTRFKVKSVLHPIPPENELSSSECPLYLVNLTFGPHKNNAAKETLG